MRGWPIRGSIRKVIGGVSNVLKKGYRRLARSKFLIKDGLGSEQSPFFNVLRGGV